MPLADLLAVALGGTGRYLAAAAAVALTLAAINAYLSGAVELAGRLRGAGGGRREHRVQLAVAGIGLLVLGLVGAGLITLDALVALPTALFVTVYALCTAAAVRLTTRGTRLVAGLACAVVLVILAFSGWALLAVAAIAVPAVVGQTAVAAAWRGMTRATAVAVAAMACWRGIHHGGLEMRDVVDPEHDPPCASNGPGRTGRRKVTPSCRVDWNRSGPSVASSAGPTVS